MSQLKNNNVTETTVNGKQYIVKSVYVGNKDINEILYNIAENKVIKEMGLI